jgi:hypothetical protein
MKKTTKSRTPQTPAAKSSKKAEAAPRAARPLRVLKPIALTAPVPAPAPAPQGPKTVVTAKVDVGFGNTLYIRGEGPGLTWDSGVPLDCAGAAEWTISFSGAQRPIVFKFLLNDETWAAGENLTVAPGASGEFTPVF